MDTRDRQLAEQLRDLRWVDAPAAEHRDRLEADLLRAWATRCDQLQPAGSRWRMVAQKGRAIMHSRITRYGAVAAAIAVVVLGLNFLPSGSPRVASRAWALEQSIAAMEEITTVYAEGLNLRDKPEPFKYWAKRDPRTGKFMFRWESSLETAIYDGQAGYGFARGREQEQVTAWRGLNFGMLKLMVLSQQMQLWMRGQTLANLKQQSQDWKETLGTDEQTGRPCVFVTASCDWIKTDWWDSDLVHFWLEFDIQTRLPIRAKAWPREMQGTPAFDFQRIVFDESIPDERFQYTPPRGATVVESGDGPALLEQARKLVADGHFADAVSLCEEIIAKYPRWWGGIECQMLMGCSHVNLDNPTEAIAVLESFPMDDGYIGDAAAYYLGVACERVGRLEDALRAYIRASQRVSDSERTGMFPDPEAREAIVRLQDRMFGDTVPEWAGVIDVKADRERLRMWSKADDLRQAGHIQQALDAYREAIAMWPPRYHRARCVGPLMLGQCYEGIGQTAKASEQFRRCIEQGYVMDSPDRWAVRQAKGCLVRLQQPAASQRATDH